MEFSYSFEVNNISLCVEIEVNYHIFKNNFLCIMRCKCCIAGSFMRGNKKKLLAEFTEGSCMITFKKSTEISTLQS